MTTQPRLFGKRPPKPRAPRRPNRVRAWLTDAGSNYRQYTCQTCDLEWETFPSNEYDAKMSDHFDRHGTAPDARRMCPRCNLPEVFEAWDVKPDEHDPTPPNPPAPLPADFLSAIEKVPRV